MQFNIILTYMKKLLFKLLAAFPWADDALSFPLSPRKKGLPRLRQPSDHPDALLYFTEFPSQYWLPSVSESLHSMKASSDPTY